MVARLVRSVDDFDSPHEYTFRMRRFWLTLLTAFAFLAGALAPAMAMSDCPMMAEAAQVAAAHDCCPDEQKPAGDQDQPRHDMDGCMMGMACRTVSAVTPTIAPTALPVSALVLDAPVVDAPAAASGPLQELFRPPRSI
ncbi:MAG: hypothetical protein AB7T08_05215 [Hyphomonadaceae bacterium]|jgi:hypothetical protein